MSQPDISTDKVDAVLQAAKQRNEHPVETFVDLSIEDSLDVGWRTTVKPSNVQELKMVAYGEYSVPLKRA